jgi:hypothetical protein
MNTGEWANALTALGDFSEMKATVDEIYRIRQEARKIAHRSHQTMIVNGYIINWAIIVSTWNGHTAEFKILADAPKIEETGVREIFTPIELQKLADEVGAILPTPKLLDLRHRQSQVQIPPQPKNYSPDWGQMVTDRARDDHSARVDRAVLEALDGAELSDTDIIDNVGKHWVLWEPTILNKQRLYGWFTPAGQSAAVTSTEEEPLRVIDAIGRHHYSHKDYSMTGMLVGSTCVVDGEEMLTADVLRSEELYGLAIASEANVRNKSDSPLFIVRVTAVPEPVEPELPVEPDDLPVPPWKDPDISLGERAVIWSRNELKDGVEEEPRGSNTGQRIRHTYFQGLTRRVNPETGSPDPNGVERPIKLRKAKWCASAFCAASWACLREGEVIPHGRRCSGIELQRDAAVTGNWHSVEEVKLGEYEPGEGDCIIYNRGGWNRHVARYIRRIDEDTYLGIGGNENDRWMETDRKFSYPALMGFIGYPKKTAPVEEPLIVSEPPPPPAEDALPDTESSPSIEVCTDTIPAPSFGYVTFFSEVLDSLEKAWDNIMLFLDSVEERDDDDDIA